MLNPFGAERFAEEYRREAEAFLTRQRLILQAERNVTGRPPGLGAFIRRMVRAVRQQTAQPESLRGALRKV